MELKNSCPHQGLERCSVVIPITSQSPLFYLVYAEEWKILGNDSGLSQVNLVMTLTVLLGQSYISSGTQYATIVSANLNTCSHGHFKCFFSGGKVRNTLLFSYHVSISTTKSCATVSFAVILISFPSTRYHTDSLHSTFMTLCSLDLVNSNSNYSRLINTLGTFKKQRSWPPVPSLHGK